MWATKVQEVNTCRHGHWCKTAMRCFLVHYFSYIWTLISHSHVLYFTAYLRLFLLSQDSRPAVLVQTATDIQPTLSTPISQTDSPWLISSPPLSIIHATFHVLMEEGQKEERRHYLFAVRPAGLQASVCYSFIYLFIYFLIYSSISKHVYTDLLICKMEWNGCEMDTPVGLQRRAQGQREPWYSWLFWEGN